MKIYLQYADLRDQKMQWSAFAGPFAALERALDVADEYQGDRPHWAIRVIREVPRFENDANPLNAVMLSPTDVVRAAWMRREFRSLRPPEMTKDEAIVAIAEAAGLIAHGTHGDHRSERNAAAVQLRQLGHAVWAVAKPLEPGDPAGELKRISSAIHDIARKLEE